MPDCHEQPCCPVDSYSYRSADAEDSQAGSRAQCPEIIVEISPVSGSYLFFPSYVVLSADHEDAVIRYTLDGTDPAEASTLYSVPFQITQSGQLLKARVFIEGCSPGPVSTALYQNPPFPIGFGYGCTTPDNAGTWNVWAPNGTVDNHWQLVFTPAASAEIQRLDVLQLDTTGAPSGIRWSTDSSPNPSQEDLHNPSVWLKADAIPGLADGAAIASWPDSTGNGNNATQATGAKQPLYKTAIVNSKPVVRFDGTDDELAASMPAGAAKAIVLVLKKRSAIIAAAHAAFGIGGFEQLYTFSGTSATEWLYHEGAVVVGGDPTTWAVVTLNHESTSVVKIYIDDVLEATADPSDSVAAATAFGLGANGSGASFGDYDIAEVLVYDTALTDAQRLDVYAYLDEKYFDPAPTYATWPLLVFVAGAQQWASYQNMLGIFSASAHTLDLYGDRQFPASGFFRVDMTLGDGSVVSSVINATCDPSLPPVACPSPAAPTATGKCDGAVDVTFANSPPQNYKIYVGTTLAASGTTATNPQTVEITGLTPGVQYFFRVELEYAGCGFQSSIPVTATPLPEPEVTINSDKLIVAINESFIISWTSNHIGGATCGGCADGEVSINQGIGCKAGNTPGSQAQSQATPNTYVYTITGCNSCGTITGSVSVVVIDAECSGPQPTFLSVADYATFLCGTLGGCADYVRQFGVVSWNGELRRTTLGALSACVWSHGGVAGNRLAGGCNADPYIANFIALCYFGDSGKWIFSVRQSDAVGADPEVLGPGEVLLWYGEKNYGTTPVGAYTKTGGCASGPSTITIS